MSAAFKKSSREMDNTLKRVLPSHRVHQTTIAPLRAALQTALMGGTYHSPVASRADLSKMMAYIHDVAVAIHPDATIPLPPF